ncbi:class 1b ribonucleoside-diphosphate reductase subunit alpha [Lactovum miscens]|uniref:Ribonucleoside-diphosphate reductase n=1 Tax=Lactovum miscens TaxID=190387 RepID=A0A841C7P9_9LACT|nr:class 1b ribonucleoside-diphosphate reductase subunit alpha [Lactovum miscens]MBB5888374.1 ribonucleoside-diphosphate reductase alpha chain [Lactovum miscens]
MSLKNIKNPTYFELNNQINIPVNGQIPLHKDKEAIVAFLKENVSPNRAFSYLNKNVIVNGEWAESGHTNLEAGKKLSYYEKLKWMIEKDYYESEFIYNYQPEFIEELRFWLAEQNFTFLSFMAAYKFYKQYALKTNSNDYYLEDPEDRALMNALYQANGDERLARDIARVIINRRYQPATPTYANNGRARRGEFASCFIIQVQDNMSDIGRSITNALQLSRKAGGVGLILGNLRSAGSPIKKMDGLASGILPVMKLFEDSFSYSNQLGTRPGAGVAYLPVFHADVIDFLSAKKENADEKVRLKTLSLGLTVPDKFYELAKANAKMATFDPYFVEKELGMPFTYVDIDKEYDHLVDLSKEIDSETGMPKIRVKWLEARALEQAISELQQESGYPYIINISTVNKVNPIAGRILGSNLCSEILQIQTPSVLNEEQEYTTLGQDIVCNLGSTNIINMMDSGADFGQDIIAMVKGLTFISDASNLSFVPTIDKGNKMNHAIGLGAMGLHSYLAANHIQYESQDAVDFTGLYFLCLNYYSLMGSNIVAQERKATFHNFENSSYASGEYFDKYLTTDYLGKVSNRIKELFKDIHIPTQEDWVELKQLVQEHGLFNSYRIALAPNGSISYVNDCSASIAPIINRIEERQEGQVGKLYYPAFGLTTDTISYYKSAYEQDMRWQIRIYEAATEHTDQGLSMTMYLRSDFTEYPDLYEWKKGDTTKLTTRDLSILRNFAWHHQIKSMYYTRQYTADTDKEHGGANECESCMI